MDRVLEGRVVDSKGVQSKQILFDDETGLIKDVGNLGVPKDKVDYSFSSDCLVFGGMGDVHIHAREDVSQKNVYKEDFCSASQAALNGGVTHTCDMPNNPTPPIDDNSYLEKLSLTLKADFPLFLYAGIGPETRPLSFKVPYKAYMGPSVGELFFKNEGELDNSLDRYQGQYVSFHCEDPEILENCKDLPSHELRRPVEAETVATSTALRLIEKYKLKGKLCHYSSKDGLPLILEAKRKGLSVECEVTPQHLYFSQEEFFGNRYLSSAEQRQWMQMNPPIRSKKDKEGMLEAFLRGDIDYLATDHAPHCHHEKDEGTSGLPGLDTYGAFVTWLLIEKKMKPELVSLACTERPGRFVNTFLDSLKANESSFNRYGKGFGKIEPGYVASFTVLNLKKPYEVKRENLKTKAKWSPFEGITFPGSVESVFLCGNRAF